jgi:hypothetical protein
MWEGSVLTGIKTDKAGGAKATMKNEALGM